MTNVYPHFLFETVIVYDSFLVKDHKIRFVK